MPKTDVALRDTIYEFIANEHKTAREIHSHINLVLGTEVPSSKMGQFLSQKKKTGKILVDENKKYYLCDELAAKYKQQDTNEENQVDFVTDSNVADETKSAESSSTSKEELAEALGIDKAIIVDEIPEIPESESRAVKAFVKMLSICEQELKELLSTKPETLNDIIDGTYWASAIKDVRDTIKRYLED